MQRWRSSRRSLRSSEVTLHAVDVVPFARNVPAITIGEDVANAVRARAARDFVRRSTAVRTVRRLIGDRRDILLEPLIRGPVDVAPPVLSGQALRGAVVLEDLLALRCRIGGRLAPA